MLIVPIARRACSILGLVSFAVLASAQVTSGELDQLLKSFLTDAEVPSVQVAVRRNGRLIYSHAAGTTNLEANSPATKRSVYEIGSVTKQFTAALCLMLEAEGKLKLDDRIGDRLPDLPEAWRGITIRQCLTHTSGLKDYLAGLFNMRKDYQPKEIIDLIAKQPLDFPPGSAWSYSNTGYYLAGMILEKITGKKYSELLNERIFTPLGMAQTRTYSASQIIPHRAVGYVIGTKTTTIPELLRESAGYSAGNIVSTAEDQTKWLEALRTGKILTADQTKLAWTRTAVGEGRTHAYGLGWFLHDTWGSHWIEHGGNTFGQSSGNFIFPAEDLVISIQTNRSGISVTDLGYRIASSLVPSLNMVPVRYSLTDPNPSLTKRLRQAIEDLSLNKATDADFTSEIMGLARTARGRMANAAGRGATGRLLRLRYVTEEAGQGVTRLFYDATYDKLQIGMAIEVTPDGRIANVSGSPLALSKEVVKQRKLRTP